MLKKFEGLNSTVLGVNTDSIPTHHAWIKSLGGIDYPLLADYDKKLAKEYGVFLDEAGGIALRGTFIIDPEGILQYYSVNNTAVGRNVMEFLRVLKALQTRKACPANWDEGQATL
jgi:peroxiredoxin (alkyl hydroperoxide reductase subunit C)